MYIYTYMYVCMYEYIPTYPGILHILPSWDVVRHRGVSPQPSRWQLYRATIYLLGSRTLFLVLLLEPSKKACQLPVTPDINTYPGY